jgi:hypothetical protein
LAWQSAYNLRVRIHAAAALVLCLAGCGRPSDRPASSHTASTPPVATSATSSASTPAGGAVGYFHDRLVIDGEDVRSDFGGALMTLGMNPRDLQQDTPEHAYQTVLQKVREVPDGAERSELMRTFFGTDTPR